MTKKSLLADDANIIDSTDPLPDSTGPFSGPVGTLSAAAQIQPAPTGPGTPIPEPAPEIPLALDEFCMRLSATERRTSLIGAFHLVQRRAGRLTAPESFYRTAFAAFVHAPA